MKDLLLHEQTAAYLERLANNPVQGLLITGEDGIGKGTVAQEYIRRLLHADPTTAPSCRIIAADDKGTIPIEKIRDLQRFLRLRTTGKARIRRAILVEHAEGMTTEAQNAFLKTLEEPPADTVIVLTAATAQDVLPTIQSRLQHFSVPVPPASKVQAYFAVNYATEAVTQAYYLSDGLPGLMSALLKDDKDHPLRQSVQQAKLLLQADSFNRTVQIEHFKQKTDAARLCQALRRIAQASLKQPSTKQDTKRIKQWHQILSAASDAQNELGKNANTKLVLMRLVLHLS